MDEAYLAASAGSRLRPVVDGRAVVRSAACSRRSSGCISRTSVRAAFAAARRPATTNVNLDLIYGADGETPGLVGAHAAGDRRPGARARQRVRADDRAGDRARPQGAERRGAASRPRPAGGHVRRRLRVCSARRGYRHYEVSNWAKPGFECRHNLGYWERRPYLGLGAGAHSYRDDRRWWNVRPPEEYMDRVETGALPTGGEERLEPSDAYLEEVFLRLRILQGIPSSWVEPERALPFLRKRSAPGGRRLARTDRARHAVAERARPRARRDLVSRPPRSTREHHTSSLRRRRGTPSLHPARCTCR